MWAGRRRGASRPPGGVDAGWIDLALASCFANLDDTAVYAVAADQAAVEADLDNELQMARVARVQQRVIAGYIVTRDGATRLPGHSEHARSAADLAGVCERCGALYTRNVEPRGRLEKARDWRARRIGSRACGSRERATRAARIAESPGTTPHEGAPAGIVLAVWARYYRHLMPREEAVQVAELMNLLPAGMRPGGPLTAGSAASSAPSGGARALAAGPAWSPATSAGSRETTMGKGWKPLTRVLIDQADAESR